MFQICLVSLPSAKFDPIELMQLFKEYVSDDAELYPLSEGVLGDAALVRVPSDVIIAEVDMNAIKESLQQSMNAIVHWSVAWVSSELDTNH